MSDQCWSTVYAVAPALVKHWVDVSCLRESALTTLSNALRQVHLTLQNAGTIVHGVQQTPDAQTLLL